MLMISDDLLILMVLQNYRRHEVLVLTRGTGKVKHLGLSLQHLFLPRKLGFDIVNNLEI